MKPSSPHMTIEKWFFLLLTTGVLFLFWQILHPFALVLLTAAVAAIILSPVDHFLHRFIKHPKLTAGILSLGVLVLIFVPLLLILLLMASQASELLRDSFTDASWLENLKNAFAPLIGILPINIQEYVLAYDFREIGVQTAQWAFAHIGNIFSSATQLILHLFIFFLALYYLIVDRERLYNEILALSPLRDSMDKTIVRRIIGTVRSVVFGVIVLSLIQGVLASIGMTIFGVPGALIWGALTAVASLVPLVGTSLILIPAILYLFFTGSTGAALGLLIWSAIVVGLADNVIGPYIIKGKTNMPAFLILLSILGGLSAFGAIGAIVGPTILAAVLALIELYKAGILTSGQK